MCASLSFVLPWYFWIQFSFSSSPTKSVNKQSFGLALNDVAHRVARPPEKGCPLEFVSSYTARSRHRGKGVSSPSEHYGKQQVSVRHRFVIPIRARSAFETPRLF